MADELAFRSMRKQADDYELYKRCFDRNDSPRELDRVAWQYDAPFVEEPLVDFAVQPSDGEVMAIYAVAPVPFTVGGAGVQGAQSLDTITDTRYQGKGLFKKLATQINARAKAQGFSLIYGFPNGNSAPAFFNRLGWHEIAPVPFKILPLRARYILERLPVVKRVAHLLPDIALRGAHRAPRMAAGAIRELTAFGPEVDALWASFSTGIGVAVRRSAEYLNWRFLEKPGENYRILGYWEGGALKGYVISTVKEKHGGRIGYVMELIYDRTRDDVGHALLSTALDGMVQARADACLAWNFDHSPNSGAFKRSRLVTLPLRLRPIELHFGALVLNDSQKSLIEEPEQWYLSYCDSDTV